MKKKRARSRAYGISIELVALGAYDGVQGYITKIKDRQIPQGWDEGCLGKGILILG